MSGPAEAGAATDLPLAARGDAAAFVPLVRLHQARVFSLALRLTGRRDDAEELAQDTFLQLHDSLARLESAAHLKHWLCRTVTHRAIDLLRRRVRRLPQTRGGPRGIGAGRGESLIPRFDGLIEAMRRRTLVAAQGAPASTRALRMRIGPLYH